MTQRFFNVSICIENSIFEDDGEGREVSRILGTITNKIEDLAEFDPDDRGTVRDLNGNTCGSWEIVEHA